MRALLIAMAVLSAAVWLPTMASCQTDVLYSATLDGSQVPGTNIWKYTLNNTSVSDDYTVIVVQLELDEFTQVISAPKVSGWMTILDETMPNIVMWASEDEGLKAGDFVSTLTAKFTKKPEFQNWTAMFNNIENPGECLNYCGVVSSQPSVPEPAGLASVVVGLVSLLGAFRRKRA